MGPPKPPPSRGFLSNITIGAATIGAGIYLLIENGKRKERHRRRRRSLMVKDPGRKVEDA